MTYLPDRMADHATTATVAAPIALLAAEYQAMLIEVFADLTKQSDIGPDDDFFEIGGDSLSAMKLVFVIEKQTGLTVAMEDLLLDPTPRGLARRLGRTTAAEESPVSFDRLYVCAGIGGVDTRMAGFRLACAERLSTVMLSYPAWTVMADPAFAFSALVDHIVAQLIADPPRGRIFLTGYSLGGVVAFAAANALTSRGFEVAFVGILDTLVDPHILTAVERHHLRLFKDRKAPAWRRLGRLRNARAQAYVAANLMIRWPRLAPFAARAFRKDSPEFNFYLNRRMQNGMLHRLMWDWLQSPASKSAYGGPVVLFRTEEYSANETIDLGWSRHCPELTIVNVAGDHETALDEPNLTGLVRAVMTSLPAAIGRATDVPQSRMHSG